MPRPKIDRSTRIIRLPKELDKVVVTAAHRAGMSVNQWIADAVREKAGQ